MFQVPGKEFRISNSIHYFFSSLHLSYSFFLLSPPSKGLGEASFIHHAMLQLV